MAKPSKAGVRRPPGRQQPKRKLVNHKKTMMKNGHLDRDRSSDPVTVDGDRTRKKTEYRQNNPGLADHVIRDGLMDYEWSTNKAPVPFTIDRQVDFLRWVAEGRTLGDICHKLNIHRQTAYYLKWRNPEFAAKWEEAKRISTSVLEDAAFKRAVRSSDSLLMFLLNARDPEQYKRYTKVVLQTPGGQLQASGPTFDASKLSQEELETLEKLMLKAGVQQSPPGVTVESVDPDYPTETK